MHILRHELFESLKNTGATAKQVKTAYLILGISGFEQAMQYVTGIS